MISLEVNMSDSTYRLIPEVGKPGKEIFFRQNKLGQWEYFSLSEGYWVDLLDEEILSHLESAINTYYLLRETSSQLTVTHPVSKTYGPCVRRTSKI